MGAKHTSTMSLRNAAELCAEEFHLKFADGTETTVWVRTPSYAEHEEANLAKLAARAQVRKRYEDGTDARAEVDALVADYTVIQLAGIVVTSELPALTEKAKRRVAQPIPPDWTKVPTAERDQKAEEWNQALDEHEQVVLAQMRELAAKREDELAESDIDKLRKQVVGITINQMVNEAIEGYIDQARGIVHPGFADDYLIFHAFYEEDHETRYFESIEEVRNLNDAVKLMLLGYAGQVNQVTNLDIKNSPSRFDQPTGPAENTQEPTTDHSTSDSQESDSPKPSSRGGRKR